MQLYPGIDTFAAYDALTPLAGTGVWPGPQEAQGGDLRSADNLMTMGETLTDRTNFIAWRLPNWIDGGTQNVVGNVFFQGAGGLIDYSDIHITIDGASLLTMKAPLLITSGATLTAGHVTLGSGFIKVTQYGGLSVDAGGSVAVVGTVVHPTSVDITGDGAFTSCNLNLTAGATVSTDATSRAFFLGTIVRSGAQAVNVLRPQFLAPVTTTNPFDPSTQDTWEIPTTHTADVILVFGIPTVGAFDVVFYSNDQSAMAHDYVLKFPGPVSAVLFDHTVTHGVSVIVRWTGSRFRVLGASDATNILLP